MDTVRNVSAIRRWVVVVVVVSLTGLTAACSGNSRSSSGKAPAPSTAGIPAGLSLSSFTSTFSEMSKFKALTAAGRGLVGVILPDTTSSSRYVTFDVPYLTEAFQTAGYRLRQFKIDNAQGVDATELSDARADIARGATVLVFDPIDSTVAARVESYAASRGVAVISYDRATYRGTKTYDVGFDNVQVGKLIGQGFEQCVAAWGVAGPKVFELDGTEHADPNAVSVAQGYNAVIWGTTTTPLTPPERNGDGYSLVGDKITSGSANGTGETIFQQQFSAHPEINATVEADDGLANDVITDLKNAGVAPKTIPTTGQGATLQGMENILQGFQCGSVYEAVYLEAQDAVALATILRTGKAPPAGLVNTTITPPTGGAGRAEPASLLTPVWVDASNMESTVIKDQFVSASTLCRAVGAGVCTAAGITP
ncbi:MAG TPA: substrate-binding domain-containing protein [Acidimicrobiales bacterium]|jgi:D-xylose transport system substrate-binding protein